MRLHYCSAAAALAALCAAWALPARAADPVFAENFAGLENGTPLSTDNSAFNYVVPTAGLNAVAEINQAGTATPLLLQSHAAGNVTFGFGVNGLPASDVYSISFDLKLNQLPGGCSLYFVMGQNGSSMYPDMPNRPTRLDNDGQLNILAGESVFALQLGGNGSVGADFGRLQSLVSNGSSVEKTLLTDDNYMPQTQYNFHMVVNTSADAVEAGGWYIEPGQLGLFIDGDYWASAVVADAVETADSFRIYTHGRSANGDYASAELGNFKIWDTAVAPIPEPAAAAGLLGLLGLALALGRRRA